MNKLVLPDYNNSIVNLACSIRKYFNLDYNHNTIKYIDNILKEKNPSNVIVILFDGMGLELIKKNLKEDSFLLKNLKKEITSVVPATTTASTTSMKTGLTPKEHGWLGWNIYIKKENKIVTIFTNKLKDTEIDAATYNVADTYFPYKKITDLINNNEKYHAKEILTYGGISQNNLDEMFLSIKSNLNIKEKNYIYAYCEEPDSIMHKTGTDSEETIEYFKLIDKKLEEFSKDLVDTLLIVVADHGHINCEEVVLENYKDFFNTLDGDIWIEGRMCSFKVKKTKEKEFITLFKKYFDKEFILKTKQEIIEEKLFGDGNIEHRYFRESLGDYFALAIGNKYFKYKKNNKIHKSTHAGFTKDEINIPLVVIDKCNEKD